MSQQQPHREPRRARHLMDPANPRPASTGGRGMTISTVQKWVMSTLAVTTVLHLVVGLLIAAAFLDTTRAGAREGLVVIAAVMGVLGVAAAFVIHQRSPATPWVLLGALPAALGAFWVL
jgi:hypothetical protein